MINKDKLIILPVSFLRDKTVLYVDSQFGFSNHFMAVFGDLIQSRFKDIGYSFAFLPDLIHQIHPDMLQYMFPGQENNIFVGDVYSRIQDLAGLNDKAGFLYKQGKDIHFRIVPGKSDREIDSAVDELIEFLQESQEPESDKICFSKTMPEAEGELSSYSKKNQSVFSREGSILNDFSDDIRFSIVGDEESLNPRTQAIIEAWEEIERRFGITIQDLEFILRIPVKLSPLHISRAGKIILTDFEGKEVKMDDLTKAIYFFYLRHPEGARLQELQDHEEEILKYYMSITGRDNVMGIRRSVNNLLHPFGNGLNVCLSRIKKAFKDIVGDRIAKYYYVDGRYAEPRKVAINRDLVIWEP